MGYFSARADLRETILCRANLSASNLYGANLRGSDLRGAIFINTFLHGAELHGAAVHGADLCTANIYGVRGLKKTDLNDYFKGIEKSIQFID